MGPVPASASADSIEGPLPPLLEGEGQRSAAMSFTSNSSLKDPGSPSPKGNGSPAARVSMQEVVDEVGFGLPADSPTVDVGPDDNESQCGASCGTYCCVS